MDLAEWSASSIADPDDRYRLAGSPGRRMLNRTAEVLYPRHTGYTLSTQSGATLKDTMVRAGRSSQKAALIYQHSDRERQKKVAADIDARVRADRRRAAAEAEAAERQSGTRRLIRSRQQTSPRPFTWG